MNIAIIGAGFSGLAASWYLAVAGHKVTVFDRGGIGFGASGIAAGLLHPFMPNKATLSWQALSGMQETLKLLKVANVSPMEGILRPCVNEELEKEFFSISQTFQETEWWGAEKVRDTLPYLLPQPALFLKNGYVIDSKAYLEGLWKASLSLGATLVIQEIHSLSELSAFDQVIVTTGSSHIEETKHIPTTCIKGQIIELSWDMPEPLPFSLNSGAYVVMGKENRSCFVGATFERKFSTFEAEPEKARSELCVKVAAFSPQISKLPFIGCRAGVRSYTRNRLPLIVRLSERAWCLTGMGAKGLLYHALMAKKLCDDIATSCN